MSEEKCVRITTIICRVIETIAVCIVIALLGWKALDILGSDAKYSQEPSPSMTTNTQGGK